MDKFQVHIAVNVTSFAVVKVEAANEIEANQIVAASIEKQGWGECAHPLQTDLGVQVSEATGPSRPFLADSISSTGVTNRDSDCSILCHSIPAF